MSEKSVLDLELEKSGLDVNQLKYLISRSKENFDKAQELHNSYFAYAGSNEWVFESYDGSRPEKYRDALERLVGFLKWGKVDLSNNDNPPDSDMVFNFLIPGGVHYSSCVPTLQLLCSDEQLNKILPLIRSNKMFVAYAQTELGHGSDVQSLETEAIFNEKTQSFIFNSPTTSSMKFWPGELSVLSNWAIVFAKLITKGKSNGVHPFLVKIRDDENHRPLPGIEIGDIGPKLGFYEKDNGFLKFTNYSCPKDALLARYYEVQADGVYIVKGNIKLMYAGMLTLRALFIKLCYKGLGPALQIATRYSIIRKQFKNSAGIEKSIIDYQLQQSKLIPQISNLYAIRFSEVNISKLFKLNAQSLKNNNFKYLPHLHNLLCGCKSVFTSWSVNGVEVARQSCGGHGYSMYSGIPGILLNQASLLTVEGDNTILLLQLARYLLKNYHQAINGEDIDVGVSYLKEKKNIVNEKLVLSSWQDFLNLELLESIITTVLKTKIRVMSENLITQQSKIGDFREAWDLKVGIRLCDASRWHVILFAFQSFKNEIMTISDLKIKKVLSDLCSLFAINQIIMNAVDIVEIGIIQNDHISLIRIAYDEILSLIRPHMLPLVEGFHYDSRINPSALADSNCKPYENLYRLAKNKSTLNRIDLADKVKELLNQKPKL